MQKSYSISGIKTKAKLLVFLLTSLFFCSLVPVVFAVENVSVGSDFTVLGTNMDTIVVGTVPTADSGASQVGAQPTVDAATTQPTAGTASVGAVAKTTVTPVVNNSTLLQTQSLVSQPDISSNTNLAPTTIKQLLPEADFSTGALSFGYPIKIPPGRNGLQPGIKLRYNSQIYEEGSIFGGGWGLDIPYIERVNRFGSDKLYTTSSPSVFTSSLSEELVTVSTGANATTFRAKVETGDFLTYSFSNNTWIVKDKKGTQYTFGAVSSTRQDDPNNSIRIFKWMLQETRDLNNNYIKYEYFKDAGQIYPSRIVYTGNSTTDGVFEVSFLRESRTDVMPNAKPAFSVTTNYRINKIDVKINGTLSHEYVLGYGVGDNGTRSVINSITEAGRDDEQVTSTLPAMTFVYQTSTIDWTAGDASVLPAAITYYGKDLGVRIFDVNGDGLQDIVKSDDSSSIYTTYLNTGNGTWAATSSWTPPVCFSNLNHSDCSVRIMDMNGDNLPDIVQSRYDGGGMYTKRIWINNGSQWVEDASWQIPLIFGDSISYKNNWTQIADVNGDGLPDIILADNRGNAFLQQVYINTSTGWILDSSWSLPSGVYFSNYFGDNMGAQVSDINGDGLADIVWSDCSVGSPAVYINTGHGWVIDTTWGAIPQCITDTAHHDIGTRFTDLNGDGLMDIVRSQYYGGGTGEKRIYYNTGKGWTENSSATLPIYFASPTYYDNGSRMTDINGSDLSDIIQYTINGPGDYTKGVYNKNGHKADLLSTITFPTGGITNVSYRPSPLYLNSGSRLNPNLPFLLQTVYQITNGNNQGVTSTVTYNYEGGKYYYNNPYDRKFAGFAAITKTDSASNSVKTFYHQGDSTNSSQGEYNDIAAKIGKPYRVEVADSTGNIYSKQINKWDSYDLGSSSTFLKLIQQTSETYDGNGTHKDKATTYAYDNSNGNTTQRIDWGEVSGSDDGSFSDVGSDKYVSDVTYAVNSTQNILGLESQETVSDQSANKVKDDKFYYDTLSLGNIDIGNLTKQESWKIGSSYVNTQKSYNTYGLVAQSTDARGKSTAFAYDSYNLYPATSTDSLGHSTQSIYNYYLGKPKQIIDMNGLVYQTIYDGLNRPTADKQPDLISPTTLVNKTTYTYANQSVGTQIHQVDYLDATTTVDTYTYTDGFDRAVQKRISTRSPNNYAVTDIVYNNLEQIFKQSLPYFSSSTAKTSPASDSTLYSTSAYDPMLRVVSVTNAVGAITNTYDDWKLTVTDANGNTKNLYKDAFDNLIKVDENDVANTYITNYTYNGLGKLTNITDALGNVRNFTYDGLGRRLTAEDLHVATDTYFGTSSFSYDDNGNLTQQIDPNGQIVNFTYDDGNRVLTEDYTGVAGTEKTYTYDTCTFGIGKLCTVTSASAIDNFTYNALGLVNTSTKTLNSVAYRTDNIYDRQGHQTITTHPDGTLVKYVYNTAGQVDQVQKKEPGDSGYVKLVSGFDYSPIGTIILETFGNAVTTTNTYDSTKLYRLTTKTTTLPGGTKTQDLTYTYDSNGNITRIVDNSQTQSKKTTNFTYDALNRLTSASSTVAAVNTIIVSWQDQSDNEDGFQVERSADAVNFIQITSTASNVVTYSDMNILPSSTYSYRVRAFNSVGNSGYASTTIIVP